MAGEAEAGINQLGKNPVFEWREHRDVLGENISTATNNLHAVLNPFRRELQELIRQDHVLEMSLWDFEEATESVRNRLNQSPNTNV